MLQAFFGEEAGILRETDFQVLLLASITAPLGPLLFSPLLNSLTGVFAVSSARIGLLLSAYTAPAIVIIPLVGLLTDQYGRKPVLVTGLTLFGIAGTAIVFTADFEVVLALRLIQGIGGSGIVPVIITSIGDLYLDAQEATAQGLRFSISGLSQAVFPLIAGILVAIAWQYPILLYAIALPIAALVHLFLEEPQQRSTSGIDKRGTAKGITNWTDSTAVALGKLLRRRQVLAMTVARGLPPFLYFGFHTYISIIVVQGLGGTPADAGLLIALSSIIMAVSASQSGRVTAFAGNRLYPLLIANGCMGVGVMIVAFATHLSIAMGGALFLGTGFGLVLSLYRSIITSLANARLRGSLVSITESVGRIGSTGGPIVLGSLVAILTPSLGLVPAVRWATFTAGAVGGGGGMVCILYYFSSPSVENSSPAVD